jgi:hypothetical protein
MYWHRLDCTGFWIGRRNISVDRLDAVIRQRIKIGNGDRQDCVIAVGHWPRNVHEGYFKQRIQQRYIVIGNVLKPTLESDIVYRNRLAADTAKLRQVR